MPAVLRKKPSASMLRVALPLSAAVDETGRIPLPTELVIAPWGESTALDGSPVIVNEHTRSVLAANQAEIGRSEIPLDFEHNTFDNPDETPAERKAKEPRKVAGYGSLEVVPNKGVIYRPLSDAWTPEGTEHYTGKHYRDLSPVPILDENGVVIAMHSVALTRAGQLANVHAYSADLDRCLKALSADSDPTDPAMKNFRAIACAALGLPETASDEDIVAAGSKKAPPAAAPLSADLETRLKAIEAGQVQSAREAIVTKATAAGKAIPLSAEAIALLPPETLQTIVDGLQAGTVPLAANTTTLTTQGGGQPKALSAEEAEVASRLGISHEDFRKVNPD